MKKKLKEKKYLIAAGALVGALVIFNGPNNLLATASEKVEQLTKPKVEVNVDYLSEAEAIDFAILKIGGHSNLKEIELKTSDKKAYYEIEMFDENYEYEIDVDAVTGKILDFEKDLLSEKEKAELFNKYTNQDNGDYITRDESVKVAKDKIGSDVALISVNLDDDKYLPHYEIEMVDDKFEYEIKVDAKTMEILSFEKEVISVNNNQTKPTNKYIGSEAAIEIAKNKINTKVFLDEIDFEDDDNMFYYEIELYDSENEYKVKVDALTGKIISFVKESNIKQTEIMPSEYISFERAIEIARSKINGKATLESIELEADDNPPKYEIEMFDNTYEYEIEIHAISGAILNFEKELD